MDKHRKSLRCDPRKPDVLSYCKPHNPKPFIGQRESYHDKILKHEIDIVSLNTKDTKPEWVYELPLTEDEIEKSGNLQLLHRAADWSSSSKMQLGMKRPHQWDPKGNPLDAIDAWTDPNLPGSNKVDRVGSTVGWASFGSLLGEGAARVVGDTKAAKNFEISNQVANAILTANENYLNTFLARPLMSTQLADDTVYFMNKAGIKRTGALSSKSTFPSRTIIYEPGF
jgi:hypothetical protein